VPRSFINSRDSEPCSEDHRRIHGIECDGVEAAHVETGVPLRPGLRQGWPACHGAGFPASLRGAAGDLLTCNPRASRGWRTNP
jgi:hypothetical protein